jgi:hypothetical protein
MSYKNHAAMAITSPIPCSSESRNGVGVSVFLENPGSFGHSIENFYSDEPLLAIEASRKYSEKSGRVGRVLRDLRRRNRASKTDAGLGAVGTAAVERDAA